MNSDETQIADVKGKFTLAVKDGRKLNKVSWNSCRILLSNKRIIFVQGNKKKQIVLQNIIDITDRVDVSQNVASVSNYIGFRTKGQNVVLVSAQNQEEFDLALYKSLLDNNMILCKHPAVEGGVITDKNWTKARIQINKKSIAIAQKDGSFIDLEYDNISNIERDDRTINGNIKDIVSVTHAIDTTTYETYLSKNERMNNFIYSFLDRGMTKTENNIDLTEKQEEVLMGLYSGVSPFELPDFTGLEIDEVEEIYDDLIEKDILDEVRVRKEVTLTSRGRNLASEAISQE